MAPKDVFCLPQLLIKSYIYVAMFAAFNKDPFRRVSSHTREDKKTTIIQKR